MNEDSRTRRPLQRYCDWWTDDLPPMHGLLRFTFYGGMLALALWHWKSPLRGIELHAATDPALFRTYGLVRLLGIPHLPPAALQVVASITTVAWSLTAIGLFTRCAAIVTACGVFALHGFLLGANALNHNWFLPMWIMIALCFARMDDGWSVDALVRKLRGRSRERTTDLVDSGFARKLVLVLAVGFYFAAGVSKLQNAGMSWLDGETISYFAVERGERHPLGPLLLRNLWLAPILSVLTLVFELGAPLALFFRRLRLPFVLAWSAMHIGIHVTLGPSYWQNMLSFVLVLSWRRRAELARARATVAAPLAGTLLCATLGAVAGFGVFWWPFTNVYMYSSYYSNEGGFRAGFAAKAYETPEGLRTIARSMARMPPSQDGKEFLAYRASLRLTRSDATRVLYEPVGAASRKQWALVVAQPVVIASLAGSRRAGEDFCRSMAPVLRRRVAPAVWQSYERVQLVARHGDGVVVLGEAAISDAPSDDPIGSAKERVELFRTLVRRTLRIEAFSTIKNARLGLDFGRDAARLEAEFRDARTEGQLLRALHQLSNLRRDGHLNVTTVPGGFAFDGKPFKRALVRFAVDYGGRERFLFVRDYAKAGVTPRPGLGDRLIAINGTPIAAYLAKTARYIAASTEERQWLELAVAVSTRRPDFDPALYRDHATYLLERRDGTRYAVTVPYEEPARIKWAGDSVWDVRVPEDERPHVPIAYGWAREPRYRDFERAFGRKSFTLHVHREKTVILLECHGFPGDRLVEDVEDLIAYAEEEKLLGHDVICDLTCSRGGKRSHYLLQRLANKPFRVTYGNLRHSEVAERFVNQKLRPSGESAKQEWLLEWLRKDVVPAFRSGREFAPAAPFKLRALPRQSNGFLQPAVKRFRGRLVCLLGPLGGSQVDQFAAMVVDNEVGHTIGMSTAGSSNTWEWRETLTLGREARPIAGFEWTIGHTLRPNGEVLEGNPAVPREHVPMTRDNFADYGDELLRRALRHLGR